MISLNLEQPERRSNPLENPGVSLAGGVDYLLSLTGGGPTASGESVSERSAMQITTFWACVSAISRAVATLPAYMFERTENGHVRATENTIYSLLTVAPNDEMTPVSFFEALQASVCVSGNAFAEIERTKGGQVVALWPRPSQAIKPMRLLDKSLAYKVNVQGAEPYVVKAEDMIHIPAMAMDGIWGLNPIEQNRRMLGLSMAEQNSASRLFGNGIMASGVLTLPAGVTTTQKEAMRESLEKSNTAENQHRPLVLPFDAKWLPLTIDPADAQFLESRKYSDEQICTMMGVPPHKVGILTHSTNNNIEAQAIQWLTDTIRPYLVRWEQELSKKLLPTVGSKANKYFIRFDVTEMLRGDAASLAARYAAGRQWGYLTINRVLEMEGQNGIGPAGDVSMVPLNMVNAEQLVPGAQPITPVPAADTIDTSSRTLIKRMSTAYGRLFRDSVGRVITHEKRDSGAIERAFAPVLGTIADECVRQASSTLSLGADYKPDTSTLLTDLYKAIEKRATKWTALTADADAETETNKAIKALSIAIFNTASTSMVLGDTNV